MATFTYSQASDQDEMIDMVEYWADKVTAAGQSIGITRPSVYKQLVQSMRLVLQAVPFDAVMETPADGSGQTASNDGNYTDVVAPGDLLKFLALRFTDWNRPVHEWVDPRSETAGLQYNSYATGDAQNPVVTRVPDSSAAHGTVFRAWPQDSVPTAKTFEYVPEMAPEKAPDDLQDIIIVQAAGYALVSDNEAGAETAFAIATELIRMIDRGKTPMVQEALQQVRQQQEN